MCSSLFTFNLAAIQGYHYNCLPSRLKMTIKAVMLIVLWDLFITFFLWYVSFVFILAFLRFSVSKGCRLSLLLAGEDPQDTALHEDDGFLSCVSTCAAVSNCLCCRMVWILVDCSHWLTDLACYKPVQ